MAASNLDFAVSADTSKARADLKLLQEELKIVGQQVRAALKAGDTAGARGLADTFGRMETQLVGLKRELNGTSGAMGELGRTTALTQRSFRSFEGAILGLGKSLFGVRAGLVGFAAVLGAEGLGRIIGGVVEDMNKLRQTASNAFMTPAAVKAFQDQMLRAGISVDSSRQALLGFAKAATDARMEAGVLGDNFGVAVRRGAEGAESGIIRMTGATAQLVRVLRGGASNAITDFSDPFKKLGIDVKSFGNDMDGMRVATAKAIQEWKKVSPEIAAGLAQAVGFGADWDKMTQQIAGSVGPGSPLDEYNKAWGDLNITLEKIKTDFVIAFFPEINAGIQSSIQEVERLVAIFEALWRVAKQLPAVALTNPEAVIGGAPGGASGGYVRGPGSGTSDSILARLSNGEFVMRARAVDRWGPQFMAALNNLQNPFGYAGGGLVRPPRFATGGMVTATTADGVTVNFNFPGGSFALRGDREIVGGLTREARRAGMLSAGKMAGALA